MSPNQRNEIAALAASTIAAPDIPHADIARVADQENAPDLVERLALNLFQSANELAAIVNASSLVQTWRGTLNAEYQRLESLRSGVRPFSVSFTGEKTFSLAGVYRAMMIAIVILFLGGLGILLNTVSISISSSGEIADLTNAPWRAAAWGFLPIAGMLAGHIAHHMATRDRTKSMISWTLVGITAVSVVGWIFAFVEGFPLGATAAAASGNLFEAPAAGWFEPLKWLMVFQLFGEVAFGGLVGIMLENLTTRGRKEAVVSSGQHDEIDQRQRDILQDRSDAERLLGSLEDYQRRFDNAAAAYAARCNALLVDMQNQMRTVRGAALINLISKYAPNQEGANHA